MMQLGGTTTTAAATPQTSDAAAPETAPAADAEAVGPLEASEEMSDRGFGGNRWPRQETLALLKIRSDMDTAFRDASVKGPLWDEVSRKMSELGYSRSSKKCKEKFENVFKYHKRTKEGRTGKSEGKTYRFFDQLEALENQSSSMVHHHQPQTQTQMPPRHHQHNNNNNSIVFSATLTQPAAANAENPPPGVALTTVTSAMPLPNTAVAFTQPPVPTSLNPTFHGGSGDFLSDSTYSSSSTSTSSDVEIGGGTRKKRKRKWKDFFERLMKQVVEKQEELQRRFLEAVEKRERERMVREEAWRMQEMARINREREILAQERSMAAAKDAAVMKFLQKLSENTNVSQSIQLPPQPQPQQPPPQTQTQTPQPQPQPQTQLAVTARAIDMTKTDNGDQNFTPASSSRWPKVEIEALIKLRTNLDSKYQENGPKGPLWEEISAGMRRLGFNRSSKRCKEKWENINKYFKKVKESNKKRPEDSKTCPYFHQLDALYRERNKFNFADYNVASTSSTSTSTGQMKAENAVPLMVQPEQQWPPAPQTQTHTEDVEQGENSRRNRDEDEEDRGGEFEGEEEEDDEDDDDDGDGGEFEIVPNNNNKGNVD
ncbi:PREDICTED: trihelix transcription factor GT-2 [Tarenaya hassleriana]|uniref:trihelix transcription factor GT-2 n=1 Tax=Tarenaya hassleriana TaxID=28532 RepID=UPI00053C730B|nr:PREDICTED: trihelix transcription factor GT-2 [Tarenaya hassleriana]